MVFWIKKYNTSSNTAILSAWKGSLREVCNLAAPLLFHCKTLPPIQFIRYIFHFFLCTLYVICVSVCMCVFTCYWIIYFSFYRTKSLFILFQLQELIIQWQMEAVLTVQHIYWISLKSPFLELEPMMISTRLIGCEKNAKTERDTEGYLKYLNVLFLMLL